MTSDSEQIQTRIFFPNISGLRFVGAFIVILCHCFTTDTTVWGDFYDGYWFQKFAFAVSRGHVAIMLFFVISGFLITYLLLDENARRGRIHIGNYLARRFLRVWPLYFIVVGFGFLVFPHLPYGISTVHEGWRFALFLSNFDEILVGQRDSINFLSATWTVSVEEQFYLVWGFLIGILRFRKQLSYPVFFLLIILGSLIFRWYYLADHRMLYYHTLSVMSDLAIGGLIGWWAYTGGARQFIGRIPGPIVFLIYAAGCLLIVFDAHIFRGGLFIIERVVHGVFFAFVLLEQVYGKSRLLRLDRIPGFYGAGKLTYGLYMFHYIFIYYWTIFFSGNGFNQHLWQFVLFVLAVFLSTYITAWLSYRLIERPVLTLKRYFRS